MRTEIAEVMIDIEAQLRQLGQWDKIPPSTEALASQEPFCVDTLTLPQWLQFVFLPTVYRMLEDEQALPGRCGIAPMAEEFFRGSGLAVNDLAAALSRIDELLSQQP
jgi:uncharacterized protein YqcC (DUF446 family)